MYSLPLPSKECALLQLQVLSRGIIPSLSKEKRTIEPIRFHIIWTSQIICICYAILSFKPFMFRFFLALFPLIPSKSFSPDCSKRFCQKTANNPNYWIIINIVIFRWKCSNQIQSRPFTFIFLTSLRVLQASIFHLILDQQKLIRLFSLETRKALLKPVNILLIFISQSFKGIPTKLILSFTNFSNPFDITQGS